MPTTPHSRGRRLAAGAALAALALAPALGAQGFVDVTATSSLAAVPLSRTPYGSGLGAADFDNDGDLDVVVPGPAGTPIRLFRNDGGMQFTDVTALAQLGTSLRPTAVAAADIDNDGDPDLLVGNLRRPLQLFVNQGGLVFAEQAVARGLMSQTSVYGISFGDYDRDGWLDIYLANREDPTTALTGQPNILYRGVGNGHFVDVSLIAGAANAGMTYTAPFVDFDEDGWPDLYCANDRGLLAQPSTLLRNQGNGTFADVGTARNAAQAMDGMGVDFTDVFNDGGVDIYVTDTPVDHLFLHWQPQASTYADDTYPFGLMGGTWAWAANWFDFDNDGWQDLHVVGHQTPNQLFRNPATPAQAALSWPEVAFANGLAVFQRQFAALCADLDDDGRVDIVNRYGFRQMLPSPTGCTVHLNQVAGGRWLGIVTRGEVSNRDGLGARVEVRTGGLRQRQWRRSGTGYLTGNDPRLHFGLGTATQADRVVVTWPSGQVQRLDDVAADQLLEVVEPTFTLTAPATVGGTTSLALSVQGDEGLVYGMVLALGSGPHTQLPDGRLLPLQLDWLSNYTIVPGNSLLSNPLGQLDAQGDASSLLAIPSQPAFLGLTLYATAATLEPQGFPAVRTIFPEAVRIVVQ